MSNYPSLESSLRSHGYSATTSRKTVFVALQKHESLTMHDLVSLCSTIDRASVYRTVELFESLGLAHRIHAGWKYRVELTDLFHNHHHHATCSSCGVSFVLPENLAIERAVETLASNNGFKLQSHQLELRGLCADCVINS